MSLPPHTARRWILLGVLFVGVSGACAWWWLRSHSANDQLVLQGNIEVRQVNLAFKVAGRIEQLLVDEGASVSEGQMLAVLDKVYFGESLAQVRAQREQSAANLAKMETGNRPEEIVQAEALVAEREATVLNAKITLDRAEQLLKITVGTRKAYDDALATHRQAEAQLNSSRQALALMRAGFRVEDIAAARAQLAERDALLQISLHQLSDAELRAPSAGVVLSRVREAGAIVNAGETVFVLSLTTPIWVRTYVSEIDLDRIQPGMEVEIKTDSLDAKLRKGRVGFISPTAEFTPKTVETRELRTSLVYRVRIVADDVDGVLRQGMPVTVTMLSSPKAVTASGSVK
jgi:HlyD family secretion protein